jgi:recombination protein RecA
MGAESGVLEKSGSWFLYNGERLGQGRENAKAYLKQHADVALRLEKALRDKFLVPAAGGSAPTEPEKAAEAPKAEVKPAKAPAKAGAR